jgi:drug/metabolite transporter (DMT)-like permease
VVNSDSYASSSAHSSLKAYLFLSFTAICFGANTTLAKLAVGQVSPMMVVTLRWLLVVVLLLVFNRNNLIRDWPALKPRLGFLFALGALGFAAFNALFYVAAHDTTAINMGIISGMLPVFILVGALIIYRTPVSKLQWTGVVITLTGVAVVASGGELGRLLELRLNRGDIFVILASLLYAGYTVALQKRPACSVFSLFTILGVSALLVSLPMVAVEVWIGEFQAPTLRGWIVVILVALFPSLLAQTAFMRGVEIIGPGRAGIFINLAPIIGTIFAVLYLGEKFHAYHGIALLLVLGGIGLAERGSKTGAGQKSINT